VVERRGVVAAETDLDEIIVLVLRGLRLWDPYFAKVSALSFQMQWARS
jgi:hypothetical protein